jgi:hypothetical protein
LRALIGARLGYDPIAPYGDAQLTVSIASRGGKLHGHVDLRDANGAPRGQRDLTSPHDDCNELASSMALAIGIAIDPLSLTRQPPTAPPLAKEKPIPPARESREPLPSVSRIVPTKDEPIAAPATASPLRLRAGFGGVFMFGNGPVATGVSLSTGVRWRRVSLDLEGNWHRYDNVAAARGQVSATLLRATVASCLHVFGPALMCLLLSAGNLHASGSGVEVARSDDAFYAAAGMRIGYERLLTKSFGVRIHGDALFSPTRIALALNDQPVWTTPLVSAVTGADLILQF